MWIQIKAPFDTPHQAQVPADGRTLARMLGTHAAQVTGCLINDTFSDAWQTYVPQQSDRITVFVQTGDFITPGLILGAIVATLIATAVNIGLQYLIRALTPTPHQTEGKVEAAYGIAGLIMPCVDTNTVTYGGELVEVPPGMAPLLRRVMGLPFRLGAKHPDEGALDCAGLVAWLLAERLAEVSAYGQRRPLIADARAFKPVWAAIDPQATPGGWRAVVQPWDVLCWQDRAANTVLYARGHTEVTWLHVGLAVTEDMLVSAVIDQGVQLLGVARIEDEASVIALIRTEGLEVGMEPPACSEMLRLR
jgi:hypothetical protein